MKTSISLVSTQMQLINCVESINATGCTQNDLIIYSATESTRDTIVELLNTSSYKRVFNSIHVIFVKYSSPIKNFKAIIKYRLCLRNLLNNSYDVCILGNYLYDMYRYFIMKVSSRNHNCKMILIDDGMAALNISKVRAEELTSRKVKFEFSSLINKCLLSSRKLKNYIIPKLEFHTNLNFATIGNDIYVNQQYDFIKNNNQGLEIKDIDWTEYSGVFLGQPLVKLKYCSFDNYNENLFRVLQIHKKIIYVPHPAEDVMQINKEYLKDILIVKSKFSFEILMSTIPTSIKIYSFNSSVLANVRKMGYNNKLEAIYYSDIKKLDDNMQIKLLNVYKYFESINIPVFYNE